MDNASIHKGDAVANVFREKGFIRLYVPPYSPWFNPIEGCFSLVKRRYPVTQSIRQSFGSLTNQHFAAFFKRSLTTYGVDEVSSATNKSTLESTRVTPNPSNTCSANTRPIRDPSCTRPVVQVWSKTCCTGLHTAPKEPS